MTDRPERELLSLRRMAARLGVPAKWLRERAVAGDVPGLSAGNRWLFCPDLVVPAVAAMARGSVVADLQNSLQDRGIILRTAGELEREQATQKVHGAANGN